MGCTPAQLPFFRDPLAFGETSRSAGEEPLIRPRTDKVAPPVVPPLRPSIAPASCVRPAAPADQSAGVVVRAGKTAPSARDLTAVEVQRTPTGWQLLRGGKPYFIKGAGGKHRPDLIAAYGGNSVRTWGYEGLKKVLDEAQRLGLSVTVGLPFKHQSKEFDYGDPLTVRRQFDEFKRVIEEFKDHPAILMWGLANELNLSKTGPQVWGAVNDVARMIHTLDGRHPTMTVLAGAPQKIVKEVRDACPDIDVLGINSYGEIAKVADQLRGAGWDRPYVITEWGPDGHWESPKTAWGAPLEAPSGAKARMYEEHFAAIRANPNDCLGSYVFLWGHKQESTPTWYGLFLPTNKEETPAVDVMQYLWTGSWPGNRAPEVTLSINGSTGAEGDIVVAPRSTLDVAALASDPDGDPVSITWELRHEIRVPGHGGGYEAPPEFVASGACAADGRLQIPAPEEAGAYRVYVYVNDGRGNGATANVPFWVGTLGENPPGKSP